MLFVLEEEIDSCWKNLKKSGFQDESVLKELNKSIIEYNNYKKSLKES
jgi:hypothetical protein